MRDAQTPILSIGTKLESDNDTIIVIGIKGHKHTDVFGKTVVFPVVQLSNGQEVVGGTIENWLGLQT